MGAVVNNHPMVKVSGLTSSHRSPIGGKVLLFLASFSLVTVLHAACAIYTGAQQSSDPSSSSRDAVEEKLPNSNRPEQNREGVKSPVEKYYEQAIRLSPSTKGLHFQLGLELWNERRVSAAESNFLQELKIDPACHRAQVMIGMAKLEENDNKGAIEYLEAARDADSTLRQAYLPLGKAWLREGNLQKAQEALEHAAAAEPGQPPVYSSLAQIYSKLGRPADAAAMSELDTKARDLRAAESFAAAGDWAKAQEADSTFLSAFPDSSRGLYIRGLVLFNGYRKIDEATQALKQSVLKDPANIEARRLLGIMDWVTGNKPAFEAEMKLVLAADPLDALAHYYWGRYAFESAHYQEAREHLELALRFRAEDERIATNLALTYEALGLPAEAEKKHRLAFAIATRQESSEPWVFLNYGAFLLNANRPTEALPVLKKAISLPKVHPKAYYLAGVAYAHAGQPAEAAACLEKAVAANPRWPEPHAALITVYGELGKTQEADAQKAILAKHAPSPEEQRAR